MGGFCNTGDRYEAKSLSGSEAVARRSELQAFAEKLQLRHLRRVRDERIAQERKRRLPTGDRSPIRRWGGRLPSFGRGPAPTYGLQCQKIETPVVNATEPGRRRGFAPLRLDRWLGDGSGEAGAAAEYELYGVIQHL